MDFVAYGITGVGLFFVFHPNFQSLGLGWGGVSGFEKTLTLVGGALVIVLTLSTFWFGTAIFVSNLISVFTIPLYEELIFRGWAWGKLDQIPAPGWLRWLAVSILFGVWHFGYADIYLLKIAPAWPEMNWCVFLLMKFVATLFIGLLVGLPRLRTSRVYGSLILHALVNLFGP